MNIPIAMPTPLGKPKAKPQNVQKEDAMWLQKELINQNYMASSFWTTGLFVGLPSGLGIAIVDVFMLRSTT